MATGVPETGRAVPKAIPTTTNKTLEQVEAKLAKLKDKVEALKPLLVSIQARYTKLKDTADVLQERVDLLRQGQLEMEVEDGNA